MTTQYSPSSPAEHHSYSGMDIEVYAVASPDSIFKTYDNYRQEIPRLEEKIRVIKEEKKAKLDKIASDISIEQDPERLADLRALQAETQNMQDPTTEQLFAEQMAAFKEHYSKPNWKKLGDLQSISYSVYRDKESAKVLGQDSPSGFTRGYTTIAGTLIFTVINEAILNDLFDNEFIGLAKEFPGSRIDQLPPLDLFIVFANEYGDRAKMSIFGVEFMNEGQVMSVQDLMTENSVNYIAKDMVRMKSIDRIDTSMEDQMYNQRMYTDQIFTVDYQKGLDNYNNTRNNHF